jgi:hypothetical protein
MEIHERKELNLNNKKKHGSDKISSKTITVTKRNQRAVYGM